MPDIMDFLDPVAAEAYRRAAYSRQAQMEPTRESQLSQLPEEEKQSLFSRMLDQSLGGLSYVGKLLDKTFGGRAIRGLLGGRPEEVASLIPGSDTLGLTQEENTVQGTDLLRHLGLITPGDNGWQNQLAGFATEVLTDPSSYIGLGPLTQGGKQLAMQGTKLAPTLAGRIAKGEAGLMSFGMPLGKTLFGIEPAIVGTGATGEALARGIPQVASYLPRHAWDIAEKYPGTWAEKLIGANPVTAAGNLAGDAFRWGRSQFDTSVLGATSKAGQQIASEVINPEHKRLLNEARKGWANAAVDIERIGQESGPEAGRAAQEFLISKMETPKDWNKNVNERVSMWNAQGMDPADVALNKADLDAINQEAHSWAQLNGPTAARWAKDLTPDQIKVLGKHADDVGLLFQQMRTDAERLGFNSPDNIDLLEYMTRQKNQMPQQANENIWQYARRATSDFNARNKFQQTRLEEFHDIPGGTLQLNELIKDPKFSGPNRERVGGLTDLAVQNEMVKMLTGSYGAGGKLVEQKAKDLAATLKKMEPYWSEEGKDFFKLDFAGNRLTREMAQAKNMSAAEGLYTAAQNYAKPSIGFKPGEGVPLTDVVDAMGFNRTGANGVRTSWDQIATRMGLPNVDDVKHLSLPMDLATDLMRIGKAWTNPAEMKPLLQAWDMLSNLFKTGVTTIFPAFHTRNAFSGLFNSWRDNAFSLGSLKESTEVLRGGHVSPETAAKLFPGLTPGDATNQLIKELVAQRVSMTHNVRSFDLTGANAAGDQYMRIPTMRGQPQPMLEVGKEFVQGFKPTNTKWSTIREEYLNPTKIAGVGADDDVNKFVKAGRTVGTAIEDTIRTSHYLEKRLQGFTPEVARESVMKYHIDYSNMTQAEKNVYKRLFPWWSFSSRNLPPVLEDLATNPGKITGAMRLVSGVRDPSEFAPAYVAEGASIPVPGAPDGFQRYITSFGLPIEDEGVKTIGSLLRGDVGRTAQQVMGMGSPFLKILPEQAFGTQLFSGRKLEDLRPSDLASLGGILPDQTARALDQIIANSPASRVFHTGDTLIDPRKDTLATLLNIGTGVRLSDIDEAKARDVAARELAKNMLRGSAEARTREEVYVPRDRISDLDPRERALLDMVRLTNQRVVDQQKLEKLQRGGY